MFKYYIVTIKLRGRAKSKEEAIKKCKDRLKYGLGFREENIQIWDVEEDKNLGD